MFSVDARTVVRRDKSMAVAQLAKIFFEMQDAPVLVGLRDQHVADFLDLGDVAQSSGTTDRPTSGRGWMADNYLEFSASRKGPYFCPMRFSAARILALFSGGKSLPSANL